MFWGGQEPDQLEGKGIPSPWMTPISSGWKHRQGSAPLNRLLCLNIFTKQAFCLYSSLPLLPHWVLWRSFVLTKQHFTFHAQPSRSERLFSLRRDRLWHYFDEKILQHFEMMLSLPLLGVAFKLSELQQPSSSSWGNVLKFGELQWPIPFSSSLSSLQRACKILSTQGNSLMWFCWMDYSAVDMWD